MPHMKYIVISYMDRAYSDDTPIEVPVMFPPVLVHKDVANHVIRAIRFDKHHTRKHECVSAGFIDLSDLSTFGKSESLNIASRDGDSKLIQEWLERYRGVPL